MKSAAFLQYRDQFISSLRDKVWDAYFLVGAACIIRGVAMFSVPGGWIMMGLFLVLLGMFGPHIKKS
jgi:hypothetical protein